MVEFAFYVLEPRPFSTDDLPRKTYFRRLRWAVLPRVGDTFPVRSGTQITIERVEHVLSPTGSGIEVYGVLGRRNDRDIDALLNLMGFREDTQT